MNARWFDPGTAFDEPLTRGIVMAIGVLLVLAPAIIFVLIKLNRVNEKKAKELRERTISWYVLVAAILLPILAGVAPTILAVVVLSLACFREYARATGLRGERTICVLVVLGILVINFAALDNWYNFYAALAPLTVCMIAAVAVLNDRPQGYTQRVALGIFGFMSFGYALGYASLIANAPHFRSILLVILLTTELNDIFAYVCGHLFGRRKMAPNTSPGKTLGGAIGALVLTTVLVSLLGRLAFAGTRLEAWHLLVALGLLIGAVGQLGDLMLSSIKRDVGVKDLGTAIPGHGGFLDRFDSLVLVLPAVFHFMNYYMGIAEGVGTPVRVITGFQ